MLRSLPAIIYLALLVYCLIDCIQSDEGRIRNLPKFAWILLIILLPIAGGVAWLVAGRPVGGRPSRDVPWPSTKTSGFPEYERPRRTAPDDDPEFLRNIAQSNAEHEQMLKDWEAQLREREHKLRDEKPEPDDESNPPSSAPF